MGLRCCQRPKKWMILRTAKGDAPMNVVPAVYQPRPDLRCSPAGRSRGGGGRRGLEVRYVPRTTGTSGAEHRFALGPAPTVTTPATTESAAAATAMEATIRLPAKYGRGRSRLLPRWLPQTSASGRGRPELRTRSIFESCVILDARPFGRRPLHDPPLGIVQVKGLHCRHRNPKAPANYYPLTATI